MAVDPHVQVAIEEATRQQRQDPLLARKIVAWIEGIVSGNENAGDVESSDKHLELLYRTTKIHDRPWEEK